MVTSSLLPTSRGLRGVLVAGTALSLLVAGLGAAGAADAASTPTAIAAQAAPTSSLHMIATNGHRLAFHVTAGTLPAIVLDAGGGNGSSYWKKIAPAIAARTGSEVITYDRSGQGRSPYVPGPWLAKNAASDLEVGLRKLGIISGVVLVSHSLAGEIAVNVANDDPGLLAGSVLIDASLPTFYTQRETARFVAANAPLIAALKKQKQTPSTRQLINESVDYAAVHRAYHRMTWPASIPATVMVSSDTPFPTALDADRWRTAQRAFADEAGNRRLIVATHSSHDIPLDRPGLVLNQIQDMVDQVK